MFKKWNLLCITDHQGMINHCLYNILNATLSKVYKEYVHICVLGDFNMPDINWSGCEPAASQSDNSFVNTVNTHSLEQLNKVPSNSVGNILDLVFINACESLVALLLK